MHIQGSTPGLYRAVLGSGCRALRIWGRSAASIDGRSRIQTFSPGKLSGFGEPAGLRVTTRNSSIIQRGRTDVMSAAEIDEGVFETTATIDNGSFGTRTIRFETGRLALQAAGAVVADSSMLSSSR